MRVNDVQHARNRHGKPRKHDNKRKRGEREPKQSPLRPSDYLELWQDVRDAKKVTEGSIDNETQSRTIKTNTPIKRGTRTVIAVVYKKEKQVRVKTAWVKKK